MHAVSICIKKYIHTHKNPNPWTYNFFDVSGHIILTLSYSSEGSPRNCLLSPCGEIGFKKILGLVLAWKSGFKVPFLPLGRSFLLQTILLNDLVGCDSPLQIVMAFWCTIIVSRGLSHPTQKVLIQIKRVPNCPLITYQGIFFKGRETLWWYK